MKMVINTKKPQFYLLPKKKQLNTLWYCIEESWFQEIKTEITLPENQNKYSEKVRFLR